MIRVLALVVALAGVAAAQQEELPKRTNAAFGYWRAFDLIKNGDDPGAEFWKKAGRVLDGAEPYDGDVLDSWLDSNAGALEQFRAAVRMPDCDFGVDYEDGVGGAMPHLAHCRTLARLVSLEGARQAAENHGDAALDCWLDGIRLARHVTREKLVISGLVAKAILSLNLRPLASWLSTNQASPKQLDRVDAALRALPEGILDWSSMLVREQSFGLHEFDKITSSIDPGSLLDLLAQETGAADGVEGFAKSVGKTVEQLREPGAMTDLLKSWRTEYIDVLGKDRDALAGPIPACLDTMKTIKTGVAPANLLLTLQGDSLLALGTHRVATEADRAGLIGVVALARYRLAHHGDPATLEGLEIPPDPFTGKPLDYRVGKEALELSSAGQDGSGKEIVFRLRK